MEKATVAAMMRGRATGLRVDSLDGNSKMSVGQCANILMEYVKLLELSDISSVMQPLTEENLPPAYGGCTCVCHRQPGVKHCIPCCSPQAPAFWNIRSE